MKNKAVLFLISIVLAIFTFPRIDAVIIPQLDTSYLLAYNYLFAHHTDYLQYLTFTFGPLALLRNPLPIGSNLALGILFQALLQFSFIFTALLAARSKKRNIIPFVLIVFFFAVLLSFDYYFYGLILFLIYFHQKDQSPRYIIWIAFITALAALIKINIGLISILIFGSYVLLQAFVYKKINPLLYGLVFTVIFFVLFWLLIFGDLNHLWRYITSFITFSTSNASALSLNPDNNWYWIISSLILFLLVPFLQNDKKTWWLYGSIFLAVYASFKYAMAREDTFHIQTFMDFMLMVMFVLFIINRKLKVFPLVILMLSLFFFYENSFRLSTTEEIKRNMLSGFHNFSQQLWGMKKFRQSSLDTSLVKLDEKKLPEAVKNLIGENTIDFYPWEVSYFLVNDLNYKPRPMLQSGSMPARIDRINAEYLAGEGSAEFMLWEFDQEYDGLTSYDERYQLNSEHLFLQAFFNNYSLLIRDEDFALYKKTGDSLLKPPVHHSQDPCFFDEWIKVPDHPGGILKVSFSIPRTFTGELVKFLYKDASFYIDYKLDKGSILSHRFAPSNAASGLWIDPYITELNAGLGGVKTDSIRLRYDEKEGLIKKEIQLDWMITPFAEVNSPGDTANVNENILVQNMHTFEENSEDRKYAEDGYDSSLAFRGKYSYIIDSINRFSPGFETKLADYLDSTHAILILDAMVYFDSLSKPLLVVEHNNDSGRIAYYSKPIATTYNQAYTWNRVMFNKLIETPADTTERLKIYIWNGKRKGSFHLDDFHYQLVRF